MVDQRHDTVIGREKSLLAKAWDDFRLMNNSCISPSCTGAGRCPRLIARLEKVTLYLRAHEHCYCKTRANMERSHSTRNPRYIRGCEAADRLESGVKKCDPMTRVMK